LGGYQPHGDDREALGSGGSKKLKALSPETFQKETNTDIFSRRQTKLQNFTFSKVETENAPLELSVRLEKHCVGVLFKPSMFCFW